MPVIIGADEENPVTLSSADWANVYCDNMNNLRTGTATNGPWHIQVAKDGNYEIRPAPLAQGSGRADRRRRAGVQGGRWRPAGWQGAADREGAAEDRDSRRNQVQSPRPTRKSVFSRERSRPAKSCRCRRGFTTRTARNCAGRTLRTFGGDSQKDKPSPTCVTIVLEIQVQIDDLGLSVLGDRPRRPRMSQNVAECRTRKRCHREHEPSLLNSEKSFSRGEPI